MAGPSFQTSELEDLLNTIDELRYQGLSQYLDLPQLIVCGDQSSGKSSVLEAISGVRFPTKDNLCTRFPTELILRRSSQSSAAATVVLDDEEDDEGVSYVQLFQGDDDILDKFDAVIEAAGDAMGLNQNDKVFSDQILRVEIAGPNLPNLTLVDIPGLFHAQSKMQSSNDAEIVKNMVINYMEMPRSIILAVVSAKNDYANQIITQYAHDVDPEGKRTMGIVTKPDTLDDGSESQRHYLELVQNLDVQLRLGWHVLRNRDFKTKDCTTEERDMLEAKFFSESPWTQVDESQLGIATLKPRLSRILRDQILVELPSLTNEIIHGIDDCERRLRGLGAARPNPSEQRIYLHNISQEFSRLVFAATHGDYGDSLFQDRDNSKGYPKRIRAVTNNLLDKFSHDMATRGHLYQVVDSIPSEFDGKPPQSAIPVTQEDRLKEVEKLIEENRGMELPGFQRFENISMLFRQQCSPWKKLVNDCATAIFSKTKTAVHAALDSAADPITRDRVLQLLLNPALDSIKEDLQVRVNRNLAQHTTGHPITFNHYFTDNLQKLRSGHEAEIITTQLKKAFGEYLDNIEIDSVAQALTSRTEADMRKFTCSEALHFMHAYYKVALKFFIDDFVIHTIEEGLLAKLHDIFNPAKIFSLDDETIQKIAGETEEGRAHREKLSLKLEKLQNALMILRSLDNN